jgi:hypothetical protein
MVGDGLFFFNKLDRKRHGFRFAGNGSLSLQQSPTQLFLDGDWKKHDWILFYPLRKEIA